MYGHPDLFSHLFQQRLERAQCCAQVSAKPADRALRLLMSARSGKLDLAFEDKEREREREKENTFPLVVHRHGINSQ